MPAIEITVCTAGALLVAAIASITDVRTRKIYNVLTFPAMLVGMACQSIEGAVHAGAHNSALAGAAGGLAGGFTGCLTGMAIWGAHNLVLRKCFGAGDTKLAGALGAFIGAPLVIITYLCHSLVYGLYSFGKLGCALPWRQMATAWMMKDFSGVSWENFNQVRKQPHAVAPIILLGLILALVFQDPMLKFLGFIH
jgi:Flp pilus assembly protein protease CpaA